MNLQEKRRMDRGPRTEDRRPVKYRVVGLLSSVFCVLSISAISFGSDPQLTDWAAYQKSGHTSPKWDPFVEAGFEALDGGNLDTGVNFLERAKGAGCKDGLVLYRLAMVQELRGDTKGAAKMLETAEPLLKNRYSKHPATINLSEHLGRLYYQLGQYDEALSEYLLAIRHQGENFFRLYLVGQMYRMKDKTKEAIAYFERSFQYEAPPIEFGPLKKMARLELMQLYYNVKDDDKALEMANQVLAEDPQNPAAVSIRDQISSRKYKEKERNILKRIIEKN